MVLSDVTITAYVRMGQIEIEPFDGSAVQPASVDLHLSNAFVIFTGHNQSFIDPRAPQDNTVWLTNDELVLHPGEFILASTKERVRLPNFIVARLEGKSSLGRLGLLVHSTAGYVDPGWNGKLTLELTNVARLPIILHAGMKVCQISFLMLSTAAGRPYGTPSLGSKYQSQEGPTVSRYHLNRERNT